MAESVVHRFTDRLQHNPVERCDRHTESEPDCSKLNVGCKPRWAKDHEIKSDGQSPRSKHDWEMSKSKAPTVASQPREHL